MDLDIDLMDCDEPSEQTKAPVRPSRFAPKGFKPPKPNSEPIDAPPPPPSVVEKKEKEDEDEEAAAAAISNEEVKREEFEEVMKDESVGRDYDDDEVEEDVIVREIDVFFNPSLDPNIQLYVFQYPLRPRWRPYELDERCQEVRVKPKSTEVEIELSMDTDSPNFDSEKASDHNMSKQILCTKWETPRTRKYAAGILMGDKLHLNPVHAVVQLRPSIEHFKSGGQKRKPSDEEVKIKSEANKEKLAVPSKQRSKHVDSSVESMTEEECWVTLKYIPPIGHFLTDYLQKMKTQESSPINFRMDPHEYLDSICPVTTNNGKSKVLDRRLLLSMPLEERIKKILLEGAPFQRYSVIKHFAPDDTDEDVLRELLKHALLVQGYFVPNNELIIPDASPQEKLARDYTLLLLFKKETVNFSVVNSLSGLSKIVIKYLNVFARKRELCKDWKFKEATDTVFKKSHPDTFAMEEQRWEARESRIYSFLDKLRQNRQSRKGNAIGYSNKAPENTIESERVATKTSADASYLRSKTMTKEIREAVLKTLRKLFHDHKVCSYQSLHDGLRDLAISKSSHHKPNPLYVAAAEAVHFPDELKLVISELAIEIDGLYALKSSTEHPDLDPLRKVVIDLFRVSGRNARFTKTQIKGAAKETLKRDITDNDYAKVMKELCESRGGAWSLKGSK